jgi:uncharacterized membrane protein
MNASGQSQSTDPRVAHYLDELNRALSGLPDAVRGEVYGDIRQHIDDELAQRPDDPSAVPEVLDRLGDPLEIAREAGAYPQLPPPQQPAQHRGKLHEIFAVILLSIGGFLAGIGWLVGLVLLWTSDRFTKADKVIGTLLVPGGFLTSLLFLGFGLAGPTSVETCQSAGSPVVSGVRAPVARVGKHGVRHAHVSHTPITKATQTVTHSVCTGGHSVWFSIALIAVFLLVILGPLYTTIRLSRRVATM